MLKNTRQTVGHTDRALRWTSRITGLAGVLGGILLLAQLHNPGQAWGATLPTTQSVTVAWDASPSTDVTGYRVYYGAASRNYTNSIVAGNVTTATVTGLASGVTYYFAVTAYDASGAESDFSNEISLVPGLATVQLRVAANRQAVLTVRGQNGHTYDIQATQSLTNWTVIGTVTLGASGSADFTDTSAASFPNRYYRTRDTQP